MHKEKTNFKTRKIRKGLVAAIGITLTLVIMVGPKLLIVEEDDLTQRIVCKFSSAEARNNPGDEQTGWIETFLLDYDQDPVTYLANNATDFQNDTANTQGYIDNDGGPDINPVTIESERYFYPCVVLRFNRDHCYDVDQWVLDRTSCRLTFSSAVDAPDDMVNGEYIDDVEGYKIEMSNVSTDRYLYVGFWWDDGANGYALQDGASGVSWNITISAQF